MSDIDLLGEHDDPDQQDIGDEHQRDHGDIRHGVRRKGEEERQDHRSQQDQSCPARRRQDDIVSEHLRIDRAVARDPAHQAFHRPEPTEMDGYVGDCSNCDENAELVDAEPACKDGKGKELRRRTENQTAAGGEIGHDHRQEWSVAALFRHTFRGHPFCLDNPTKGRHRAATCTLAD